MLAVTHCRTGINHYKTKRSIILDWTLDRFVIWKIPEWRKGSPAVWENSRSHSNFLQEITYLQPELHLLHIGNKAQLLTFRQKQHIVKNKYHRSVRIYTPLAANPNAHMAILPNSNTLPHIPQSNKISLLCLFSLLKLIVTAVQANPRLSAKSNNAQ